MNLLFWTLLHRLPYQPLQLGGCRNCNNSIILKETFNLSIQPLKVEEVRHHLVIYVVEPHRSNPEDIDTDTPPIPRAKHRHPAEPEDHRNTYYVKLTMAGTRYWEQVNLTQVVFIG